MKIEPIECARAAAALAMTALEGYRGKGKTGPAGLDNNRVATALSQVRKIAATLAEAGTSPRVTPEHLGKLLFEEFERDSWGDVDPSYFKDPPRVGAHEEMGGIYEVLERVAKRLNGEEP